MTNTPELTPPAAAAVARARKAVKDIAAAEAQAKRHRDTRDWALKELRADGLTVPQIAAATGINLHTVRLSLR